LGLAYQEVRDPGPVAPGVNVICKLAVQVRPNAPCAELADESIGKLSLSAKPELLALEEESPDGFWRLAYDRRWYLTALTDKVTVLRLVDRGSYLGQCKISRAAMRGRPMTLAQFQADIRDALGKQFGQFLQASELKSTAGTPIYRVEVRGVVADVPVVWIYYWVGSPNGEALILSFTLEEGLRDRFAEADKELMNGLHLRADRVAARSGG
jgi:hypothetical protein